MENLDGLKKIGVVTYHKSFNYGALLQSIASRYILNTLGYEAYYVDYWPRYHQRLYTLFEKEKIFRWNIYKSFKYLLYRFKMYGQLKKRYDHIKNFISVYIEPYCRPVTEHFDCIIYGSDQIWRKQPMTGKFNPVYFGLNNFHTQRNVSYAASMGVLPDNEADKEYIRGLLSHLNKISVRENDLLSLVKSLGYNGEMNVDPTLLLKKEQWEILIPPTSNNKGKYVLHINWIHNSFLETEIDKFAQKRGCKVIEMYQYVNRRETDTFINSADPSEFVNMIRNAEFVFTSSFHGLVFSIIANRPFYASFRTNSGRGASILDSLGLSKYLLLPNTKIDDNYYLPDYNEVNVKLIDYRKQSIDYLKKICNE